MYTYLAALVVFNPLYSSCHLQTLLFYCRHSFHFVIYYLLTLLTLSFPYLNFRDFGWTCHMPGERPLSSGENSASFWWQQLEKSVYVLLSLASWFYNHDQATVFLYYTCFIQLYKMNLIWERRVCLLSINYVLQMCAWFLGRFLMFKKNPLLVGTVHKICMLCRVFLRKMLGTRFSLILGTRW